MDDKNRYSLWTTLRKEYDNIPDFQKFDKWLTSDTANVSELYKTLAKDYDNINSMGYEKFRDWTIGVQSSPVLDNPESERQKKLDELKTIATQNTPITNQSLLSSGIDYVSQAVRRLPSDMEIMVRNSFADAKLRFLAESEEMPTSLESPVFMDLPEAKKRNESLFKETFEETNKMGEEVRKRWGIRNEPNVLGDIIGGLGTTLPILATSVIPVVGPTAGITLGSLAMSQSLGAEVYDITGDVELSKTAMTVGLGLGSTEALPILDGLQMFKNPTLWKSVLKESVEEGLQEMFQTLGEEATKDILGKDKYDLTFGEYAKTVGYAGLVGAAAGGIMSGPLALVTRNARIKAAKKIYNSSIDQAVKQKKMTPEKGAELKETINSISNSQLENNIELMQGNLEFGEQGDRVVEQIGKTETIDEAFISIFGQEEGEILAQSFWSSPYVQNTFNEWIAGQQIGVEVPQSTSQEDFKRQINELVKTDPNWAEQAGLVAKLAVIDRMKYQKADALIGDAGSVLSELDYTQDLFEDNPLVRNTREVRESINNFTTETISEVKEETEEKPRFQEDVENKVDYRLKVVDNIVSNLSKIKSWESNKSINEETLYKKISELGIPKEQIKLLKNSQGDTISEKLTDFIASYSYPIETNIMPTQIYSDMVADGGTNYTENEIAIPAIRPGIKGHAEFSTANGIGWFRADEQKNNSEIRRINEIQSDLFQKGRDNEGLVSLGRLLDETYDEALEDLEKAVERGDWTQQEADEVIQKLKKQNDSKENQFLQLLNKDNNWVTFFVKSIIQDSAKKGYEKVLFPTGNTASKVEGHTTLEEENNTINNRIKTLEFAKTKDHTILRDLQRQGIKIFTPNDNIDVLNQHDYQGVNKGTNLDVYSKEESENPNYIYKALADKKYTLDDVLNRSIEYEKNRKQYLEKEGFAALTPIYNFYENTIFNILKKQGYNPEQITDEYNQTWYEVEIKPERDLSAIRFQRETTEIPSQEIYPQLGNKTESGNVVIKPVYQKEGIAYAKSINGIFSMRVDNSDTHFGNPFSSDKVQIEKGLLPASSTEDAVRKYIDWVLNSQDKRAIWIRNILKSGKLKGKPIVYYKELGEPSHATALDYLINKYDWNNTSGILSETPITDLFGRQTPLSTPKPPEVPVDASVAFYRDSITDPVLGEFGKWVLDRIIKDKVTVEYVGSDFKFRNKEFTRVRGMYSPILGRRVDENGKIIAKIEHTIYINRDFKDPYQVYRTLVHEGVHYLFQTTAGKSAPFRQKISEIYHEMRERLITPAQEGTQEYADYEFYLANKPMLDLVFNNPEGHQAGMDEMLAYIMSNTSALHAWASKTMVKGKEQTFLQKFKDLVMRVMEAVGFKFTPTYKQVLDTLLEETFNAPNPLNFANAKLQAFEKMRSNELASAYKETISLDENFQNPKIVEKAGNLIANAEGIAVEDGIAYIQNLSYMQLTNKLFTNNEWMIQTKMMYDSDFKDKKLFETQYKSRVWKGLVNPDTGIPYEDSYEGRLEAFRYSIAVNLYERANSLVKLTHAFVVEAGKGTVQELPLEFQDVNKTWQNSYAAKTRLDETVSSLNQILGVNLQILPVDNVEGLNIDELSRKQNLKDGENYTNAGLMRNIGRHGEYFYLGSFADKNTTYLLKPAGGTKAETIRTKIAQLREVYLQRLSDYMKVHAPSIPSEEASKLVEYLSIDSFVVRLLLEDLRLGATYNPATGQILNHAILNPNDKASGDALKIFKRPYDVFPRFSTLKDRKRNNNIFKNIASARRASGISLDQATGEFKFTSVIFNASEADHVEIEITQKDENGSDVAVKVPLSKYLKNNFGTESTDGIVYYLDGGFGEVFRQVHATYNDGAIKAHLYDLPSSGLTEPLFIKSSYQKVHPSSPLGQWMIKNGLALAISSSAAKVSVGKKYDSLFSTVQNAFEVPLSAFQRIGEKGKYEKDAKGILQSLTANFISPSNKQIPANSLEAMNEAMSGVLAKIVGQLNNAMANFDEAEVVRMLKKAAEDETNSYSKTMARIILSIAYQDETLYTVPTEEEESAEVQNRVIKMITDKGYGDLYKGLMNDPYFGKFLQSFIWKRVSKALNYQAPASYATLRPDIGPLDGIISKAKKFDTSLTKGLEIAQSDLDDFQKQYADNYAELADYQKYVDAVKQEEKKLKKIKSSSGTYIEEAFDEFGLLKEGWAVLAEGYADLYDLQIGDEVIVSIVPSTNARSQIPVRIAAFGKHSTMEAGSIKGNSYQFQTINGRDFDIDVVHLMPYTQSYFGSKENYLKYWNMLNEAHKIGKKRTLKTYQKVLETEVVNGKTGAELTEEDLFNQDVQIAYQKIMLGSSDLNQKFVTPIADLSVLDKYNTPIGIVVSRKKIATTMDQIGFTIKIAGTEIKANVSDEVYIMHELLTNHIVDSPNNTSSMYYNTDPNVADMIAFSKSGEPAFTQIAKAFGMYRLDPETGTWYPDSATALNLVKKYLQYFFGRAMHLTKDNDFEDRTQPASLNIRFRDIQYQKNRNVILGDRQTRMNSKVNIANEILDDMGLNKDIKQYERAFKLLIALVEGTSDSDYRKSPLLNAIQQINLQQMPDITTSERTEAVKHSSVVETMFSENENYENMIKEVLKAYPNIDADFRKLKSPVNRNYMKAFLLSLANFRQDGGGLHRLKAKVVIALNPFQQNQFRIHRNKGTEKFDFLTTVFNSANLDVFPLQFLDIIKSLKIDTVKNFEIDEKTKKELSEGSSKFVFGKNKFRANAVAGDESSKIDFWVTPDGRLQMQYAWQAEGEWKRMVYGQNGNIYNELVADQSERGQKLLALLTTPSNKSFWTSEKIFVFNKLVNINKSISIPSRIKLASDFIRKELTQYPESSQELFWKSFMGYPDAKVPEIPTILNAIGPVAKEEKARDNGKLYELAVTSELKSGENFIEDFLKRLSRESQGLLAYDVVEQLGKADLSIAPIIRFQTEPLEDALEALGEVKGEKDFNIWQSGFNIFDIINLQEHSDSTNTNPDVQVTSIPSVLTGQSKPLTLRDVKNITTFVSTSKDKVGWTLEEIQLTKVYNLEKELDQIFVRDFSVRQNAISKLVEAALENQLAKKGLNDKSIVNFFKRRQYKKMRKEIFKSIVDYVEKNPYGITIQHNPITRQDEFFFADMKDAQGVHIPLTQDEMEKELERRNRIPTGVDEKGNETWKVNATEVFKHLGAIELHKIFSVSNVKLIENVIDGLKQMRHSVDYQGNEISEAVDTLRTIEALLKKYTKMKKTFEGMKFKYFPHVWDEKEYKKQYIERRKKQGASKELIEEELQSNKRKQIAMAGDDRGIVYSFMKKRISGLKGYKTDSMEPIKQHQAQLKKSIENDLVAVMAKQYEFAAKGMGKNPKMISLMKAWFMLASSSSDVRSLKQPVDTIREGQMVKTFVRKTVLQDPNDPDSLIENYEMIKGEVQKVTDTTVTIGANDKAKEAILEQVRNQEDELRLLEEAYEGMDDLIPPATFSQKKLLDKMGWTNTYINAGTAFNQLTAQRMIVKAFTRMYERSAVTVKKKDMFTLDLQNGKEGWYNGFYKTLLPTRFDPLWQAMTAGGAILGIGGPAAGITNYKDGMYALWRDIKTKEMISRHWAHAKRADELFKKIEDKANALDELPRVSKLTSPFGNANKEEIYDQLDAIVADYFLENGLAIEAKNLGISTSVVVDTALKPFKVFELRIRRRAAYTFAAKALFDGITDPAEIRQAVEQGVARTQGLYTNIFRRVGERTSAGRFSFMLSQYTKFQREVEKQNRELAYDQFKKKTWKENAKSILPFTNKSLSTKDPDMVNKTASQIYKDLLFFGMNMIVPGITAGNPVYRPLSIALTILFHGALGEWDFDDGEELEGDLLDLLWAVLALKVGMGVSVGLNLIGTLAFDAKFRLFNTKVINGLGMVGNDIYKEIAGKEETTGQRQRRQQAEKTFSTYGLSYASFKRASTIGKTLTGIELMPTFHPFMGPKQAQSQLISPIDPVGLASYHVFDKKGFLETLTTFAFPAYSTSKHSIWRDDKAIKKEILEARKNIRLREKGIDPKKSGKRSR